MQHVQNLWKEALFGDHPLGRRIDGSIETGFGEPGISDLKEGTFLQFERVGFARIYHVGDPVRASFAHK